MTVSRPTTSPADVLVARVANARRNAESHGLDITEGTDTSVDVAVGSRTARLNRSRGTKMARVRSFFKSENTAKPHPTDVECGYQVLDGSGGRLLQLSTYGSDQRQSEKKVSQTLQLDERRAQELVTIIQSTFPTIR